MLLGRFHSYHREKKKKKRYYLDQEGTCETHLLVVFSYRRLSHLKVPDLSSSKNSWNGKSSSRAWLVTAATKEHLVWNQAGTSLERKPLWTVASVDVSPQDFASAAPLLLVCLPWLYRCVPVRWGTLPAELDPAWWSDGASQALLCVVQTHP